MPVRSSRQQQLGAGVPSSSSSIVFAFWPAAQASSSFVGKFAEVVPDHGKDQSVLSYRRYAAHGHVAPRSRVRRSAVVFIPLWPWCSAGSEPPFESDCADKVWAIPRCWRLRRRASSWRAKTRHRSSANLATSVLNDGMGRLILIRIAATTRCWCPAAYFESVSLPLSEKHFEPVPVRNGERGNSGTDRAARWALLPAMVFEALEMPGGARRSECRCLGVL